MGYFDALSNASFKTGDDGSHAFYPWGKFGRGYTVSPEQRTSLQNGLSIYYIVGLGGVVLLPGLYRLFLAAIFMLGFASWALLWQRGKPVSPLRLTIRDAHRAMAEKLPSSLIWIFIVFFGLFAFLGLFMVFAAPKAWIPGLLMASLFGAGVWFYLRLWRIKKSLSLDAHS